MKQLRKDFPILDQKIGSYNLIYFDNASTSQKPQFVLDALFDFYTKYNSNIYRSVSFFAEKATTLYEDSRCKIASSTHKKNFNTIVNNPSVKKAKEI